MKPPSKIITNIKCPDCGQPVKVEFDATFSPLKPTGDGDRVETSITATQSAPMVCVCGFTYAPTRQYDSRR